MGRAVSTRPDQGRGSADLRRSIVKAAADKPIIVQFSRGKDAIAATIALQDDGADVRTVFLESVPGLEFVRESLAKLDKALGLAPPTLCLPHPSLYRLVHSHVFRPPEQLRIVEKTDLFDSSLQYGDVAAIVTDHFKSYPWMATGVRAADSPIRRTSILVHGPFNEKSSTVHAVWDWTANDVESAIRGRGVKLPVDYRIWGRTFDGFDYRFTRGLRDHFPREVARVKEVFPLVEADLYRIEHVCKKGG